MNRLAIKSKVSAHKFAFGSSISMKKIVVEPFAAAHSRQDALTAFETRSQRKRRAHGRKDTAHGGKDALMAIKTPLTALRIPLTAKKTRSQHCGHCARRKNTAHGVAGVAHDFQDARTAKKTFAWS